MADSQKTTSQTKKSDSRKPDKKSAGQKNSQREDGQSQGQKEQQKGEQKQGIGWPEWITFGISLVIILSFVVLQLYLHWKGEVGPPRIFVQSELSALEQEGSDYYLPVEVTNDGGSTAEDVSVQLTFKGEEGNPETASFLIEFLAPEESARQVVVFKTDPRQGELSYSVTFKNR